MIPTKLWLRLNVASPQMVPEEMQAAERSQRNTESPKSSSEEEPISPNFSDGKGNKVRLIGTDRNRKQQTSVSMNIQTQTLKAVLKLS